MENFGRREFIKSILWSFPISVGLAPEALASKGRVFIELPPFPIQNFYLKGERKGGRILIVGGIHGNEPGGYKAADILRSVKVRKGELFIVPRINFVSILADKRGYNGDMNRKFQKISKSDPDYSRVEWLREFIREVNPDLLLTLHDGFGFHVLNPRFWGQCIVIDDEVFKGIELGKPARIVSRAVNRKIKNKKWKIPVFNTKTFDRDTKHPEQRKSLTYFCLKNCRVPAICLETSKQMPNLQVKVKFHLLMMKEFFKLYNVEIEPDFDYLLSHLDEILDQRASYSVSLLINNRRVEFSSSKEIKLPPGSSVKFLSFHGTEGTNGVFNGVNKNLRSYSVRKRLSVDIKDDFETKFSLRFIVG